MTRIFDQHPVLGRLCFAALLVLAATFAHAQVPVGMAPPLHFQFLNASGQPLANGTIYTYAAGTTTCLNTYVDATGTTQNPCVILLDSTGSPSNGSTQTGIFLANNSYKFVAFDANNAFQWSVDNVSSYFGLLNSNNIWTGTNTFDSPITILATDQQIVLGASGNQTALDFPPPAGNITLEFPNTADTMVGRNTTDTLLHKSLVNPTINGVQVIDSPGTYISLPNSTSTGTSLYTLTQLTGASQGIIAPITATGGVVGVCLASCGITGNATIVESGAVNCFFDSGSPVANDYVTISQSVAGNCHDAGATYPNSGQVIGRVTAGGGLLLFGPEVKGTASVVCSNTGNVSVNGNTTSFQLLKNCAFLAGVLNHLGATFRMTFSMLSEPAGGSSNSAVGAWICNSNVTFCGIDVTTAVQASSSTSWYSSGQVTCTVSATGSSGTLACDSLATAGPTSAFASSAAVPWGYPASYTGIDLTNVVYVGTGCSFSIASGTNNCVEQDTFVVEQLD